MTSRVAIPDEMLFSCMFLILVMLDLPIASFWFGRSQAVMGIVMVVLFVVPSLLIWLLPDFGDKKEWFTLQIWATLLVGSLVAWAHMLGFYAWQWLTA
ncbi:hypothetical protein [Bremerella cremea]|uniref:hypothetical protein n=1 Tax=Bremerella cremea TaxID=1031537 RepID=UPI0031EADD94